MLPEIMGYRRPDGRFGIRNHIAVIATMDNANPTVRRICSLVKGCVPFCPGFGRGEMNEDLALHNLLSINTALHPNVYGVIVVALEDQTAEYISGEIAKGGKPVVGFSIEDQGGTVEVAYRAAQAAIQMLHDAGRLRPEPMPWSEFVLGVECGGSDGSSGIVSNPVTGRLADRVIDAGGTVIMSETLELLGGEEMLGRRAVTPEVAAKVKGIIQRTLDYAAEHNLDIMGANPAPDNIAGGLTTIEEKALGAIKKGDEVIGNETRVKVVKNKVAPPFKQAEFDILYGEGISRYGEIIDIGTELNVLEKSGAWYSYNGQRLGQGKENVREFLKQHPDVCGEVEQKIREMKGIHLKSISAVDGDDEGMPEDDLPLADADIDL